MVYTWGYRSDYIDGVLSIEESSVGTRLFEAFMGTYSRYDCGGTGAGGESQADQGSC
jgi:hypothetical protein